MIKVEELETEIEEDSTGASESREAAEAAEEAGDGRIAQQDIKAQEEYKGKAAVSKEEQRQYEETAGKGISVERNCKSDKNLLGRLERMVRDHRRSSRRQGSWRGAVERRNVV
ncbi:MAG TPA: hypothetical protein VMB51_14685 [Solirubrobacteraceae bacterium]|nr:hypothetical protein [Solirubrobacteraceae bacterium]